MISFSLYFYFFKIFLMPFLLVFIRFLLPSTIKYVDRVGATIYEINIDTVCVMQRNRLLTLSSFLIFSAIPTKYLVEFPSRK
jgi:hypothetical protein